jgi:hypothetical protein
MCPTIDNPTSCGIRTVISFLYAKNMSVAEIHNELCAAYSQNAMSEGTVRQWCRLFKDGRTNVHDEQRTGWPASVVNDDLQIAGWPASVVNDDLQIADQKICERQCFP